MKKLIVAGTVFATAYLLLQQILIATAVFIVTYLLLTLIVRQVTRDDRYDY